MESKKILILGASGLLGSFLVKNWKHNYSLATQSFSSNCDFDGDLVDVSFVEKLIFETKPYAVINTVALANVDQCEELPKEAFKQNALIVKNLVQTLEKFKLKSHLIHISTDQVYDSKFESPENDVILCNYYAYSKYIGDIYAREYEYSTVLRTNFFGFSGIPNRKSFSDWIIEKLKSGEDVSFFSDVFFSPLSMDTLAEMILFIIKKPSYGVYNLGSREGMSKAEFAQAIANKFNLSMQNAKSILSSSLNFKARRPLNMKMDVSLFEKEFDIKLPTLLEEIRRLS